MKITSKELTDIFQKHVENLFPNKELKPVEITVATNENFGDYQCNFAMINSKIIGDNPRKIAEEIKNNFPYGNVVEKLEVAGPGFINILPLFLNNKKTDLSPHYGFSRQTQQVVVSYLKYTVSVITIDIRDISDLLKTAPTP